MNCIHRFPHKPARMPTHGPPKSGKIKFRPTKAERRALEEVFDYFDLVEAAFKGEKEARNYLASDVHRLAKEGYDNVIAILAKYGLEEAQKLHPKA